MVKQCRLTLLCVSMSVCLCLCVCVCVCMRSCVCAYVCILDSLTGLPVVTVMGIGMVQLATLHLYRDLSVTVSFAL